LSAGFGKSLNKSDYGTAKASGLQNWFDPTRTVGGEYSSDFLKDYSAKTGFGKSGREYGYKGKDGFWGKDAGYTDSEWQRYKNEYKDWKYGQDAFADVTHTPGVLGQTRDPVTEIVPAKRIKYGPGEGTVIPAHDKVIGHTGKDIAAVAERFDLGDTNLNPDEQKEYLGLLEEGKLGDAKDYLEGLDTRGVGYDPGFFGKAADFGSGLAGAILPGFGEYDEITGEYKGFNLSNAIQTVAVAGTLASVMAIKDAIEKEKDLDEAEERKIWKEWFDSYERTTGHTYEFSPYREDHLWDMYQKYMAKGGRVGYNLGGGIMEAPGVSQGMQAPGVPQGMQLDGRDGAFVPQGIEEKADDVPAMLSKNEFVLTADAMRGLDKIMGGRGDPRAAAQHMYQMMDQLEAVA